MSISYTETGLNEASLAIKVSKSYQVTKGEKILNAVGDTLSKFSDSQLGSAAQSDIASTAFSVVKEQVGGFVENSKILCNILDEVGKAHPFVQVAVSIFKAAIQLELTRRGNDSRVVALNVTMCDMMSVLTLLRKVASPSDLGNDGITIEDRLRDRMGRIIDSIKSCAKLCDSYQRRGVAVKFFTGPKWQGQFEAAAQQFVDHKAAIQMDLQIHASIVVTETNATMKVLNENVSLMMKMVFERMAPPEERDISTFVESKGGAEAVLKDDRLLKQALDKQPKIHSERPSVPGGGGERPGDKSRGDEPVTLTKFKSELSKNIDEILAENSKLFERKFEAIEISLREVKVTIHREGDRVIQEILTNIAAGPHERIIDKDLYLVWKEMGWKSSVKASHLVLALNEHFLQKATTALSQIQAITDETDSTSAEEKMKSVADITKTIPAMPREDLWTLEYITITRVQPLIEVLDDDGSSFVTVNELNKFTAARPEGWSLPRWIAYWTQGFEMTCQWYYRRIRRIMTMLSDADFDANPANRNLFGQFISSYEMKWCQFILSGLRGIDDWNYVDWENDIVFLKFKDWILENEKKYKSVLRTVLYWVDQGNTLTTVTGSGERPESYFLPVLFLLLERALWVMQQGKDVVLHHRELECIQESINTLCLAACDRVTKLQSIYSSQNLDVKEKLKRVFFGMWTYVVATPEYGPYWERPFYHYGMVTGGEEDPEEPPLVYGAQREELEDVLSLARSQTSSDSPSTETSSQESLVGNWSGSYTYHHNNSSDGLVSLTITAHSADGSFEGSGIDYIGPFVITGKKLEGAKVSFTKTYTSGEKNSLLYSGKLQEDGQEMTGNWNHKDGVNEEPVPAVVKDSEPEPPAQEDVAEVTPDAVQDSNPEEGQELPEIQVNSPTSPGEIINEDQAEDDAASEIGSVATDATQMFSGGGFVMYRRPVDYFLYKPSDEEMQANKTQALWQMVRNVARYWYRQHHLSADGISERRNKRKMLEGFLHEKYRPGWTLEDENSAKWEELVRSIHPDDLRLWRATFLFKQRREMAHGTVYCDSCGASPLRPSRLCCITCSKGEVVYGAFDLCKDCWSKEIYRKTGDKHHTTSHALIQVREAPFATEMGSLMNDGRLVLGGGVDEGMCHSCEKRIEEKPFWQCIICSGTVLVCSDCNTRDEDQKPWCFQRKNTMDEGHDPLHRMVLVTDTTDLDPLSMQQRLTSLESKIQDQASELRDVKASISSLERSVTDRFDHVESLLERVLAAVAVPQQA